jgi:hypothetical protein
MDENLPNDLNNQDLKLNIASLFMDQGRFYAFIKKISPHLWFTRSMTRFMIKNFSNKELIGVEIGVNYGLNAKTMLKYLSIEKLYLIDPYYNNQDNITGDQRYNKTKEYLAKYKNKIKFIRKKSEQAFTEIPNDLDFIYIDGAHEYENVKKDIELYYKKVKKGGLIGGHDFWASEIGVCKAVLEFVKNNNLRLYGKLTDWWIIKK